MRVFFADLICFFLSPLVVRLPTFSRNKWLFRVRAVSGWLVTSSHLCQNKAIKNFTCSGSHCLDIVQEVQVEFGNNKYDICEAILSVFVFFFIMRTCSCLHVPKRGTKTVILSLFCDSSQAALTSGPRWSALPPPGHWTPVTGDFEKVRGEWEGLLQSAPGSGISCFI